MFSNDGEIPETLLKQKIAVDPLLAEGLDFDAHDLTSNHDHLLSDYQIQVLNKQKTRVFWEFMGIFMTVGIIITAIGVTTISDLKMNQMQVNLAVPFIGVSGLIIIPLLGRYLVEFGDLTQFPVLKRDITDGVVSTETGVVILDNRKENHLIMNEQEFNLTREAFLRFKHLERYTIYYAPRSKIILSAESA